MFTGIIEEIGTVNELRKGMGNALIIVECRKILEDMSIGDSISIDGVCQTVTYVGMNSFSVQASFETLSVTTFANLQTGDTVNLERALTPVSRMGGHVVTGHVDGLAKVKDIQHQAPFYNFKFEVDRNLAKYVAKKGSVAINGISLTVSHIFANEFDIAVIPHTYDITNLDRLKTGDFVNIEVDILAKYVEKVLSTSNNKTVDTIDVNFLKENGFL